MVNQVRKTGVCDLYHGLDNIRSIFDLQQSGATTGSFIEMTISWEGHKKTVPDLEESHQANGSFPMILSFIKKKLV